MEMNTIMPAAQAFKGLGPGLRGLTFVGSREQPPEGNEHHHACRGGAAQCRKEVAACHGVRPFC